MAIAVEPKTRAVIRRRRRPKTAVIDCDIHNALPSDEAIRKYLPQRWRNHHRLIGLRGHNGCKYPRASPNAARHDSWPPSGLPAGSDLDFMREQLLDEWDLEYGLLNCLVGAGQQQNLEFGAAFARKASTTGRSRPGWNPSRGCGPPLSSPTKMASCRRPRSTAWEAIPASSRCWRRSARNSLWAGANTGRCTRPASATISPSASTSEETRASP